MITSFYMHSLTRPLTICALIGGLFTMGVVARAFSQPVPVPVFEFAPVRAPALASVPASCEAGVYRVHSVQRNLDGDTIALTLDLGMDVLRVTQVRLADVDTWEVRGAEKDKGMLATEASSLWLHDHAGRLEFVDHGDDKYGGRRDGLIRDIETKESLGAFLRNAGHQKEAKK